jgi:hypothetical protein
MGRKGKERKGKHLSRSSWRLSCIGGFEAGRLPKVARVDARLLRRAHLTFKHSHVSSYQLLLFVYPRRYEVAVRTSHRSSVISDPEAEQSASSSFTRGIPPAHLITFPRLPVTPSSPHLPTTKMLVSLPRLLRSRTPWPRSLRAFSTTLPRLQFPIQPNPIPYVEACPSPTCACAPAPPDLDIDRKTPLLNTMAPYTEQVLLCTGKDDWTSNLEDDGGDTATFVKGLKSVIGKGGSAFDVCTPPPHEYNTFRNGGC